MFHVEHRCYPATGYRLKTCQAFVENATVTTQQNKGLPHQNTPTKLAWFQAPFGILKIGERRFSRSSDHRKGSPCGEPFLSKGEANAGHPSIRNSRALPLTFLLALPSPRHSRE
jgi:hypothetical protein